MGVNIPDGRLEVMDDVYPEPSRTLLRVCPVEGTDEVIIKLSTNHHSFSLRRSVTMRSISSAYFLHSALRESHPYTETPALPNRLKMMILSFESQCEAFADFLQHVLETSDYLSSKALHLYLQTNLSLEDIDLNVRGERDDEVCPDPDPYKDKRTISNDGFSEIFC